METLQAGVHSGSSLSVSRFLHLANAPFSRMITVFEKLTVAYLVKKFPAPKEPSKVHYYCMDLTLNKIHLVQTVRPYLPKNNTNINIPFRPLSPRGFFPSIVQNVIIINSSRD
jgi:hypothetical protein